MTTAANAWTNPTLPDIFYEEAEPVEDGMLEGKAMDRITQLLRERYGEREDVFISTRGKIFISYDQTNGNARVAPDLFIAFGVPATAIEENLPNFWIWETGKAPDLVIEAASESTAANDLGEKREIYAGYGVAEYWRFDHTGGRFHDAALAGDRLLPDGSYQPIPVDTAEDGSTRGYSAVLGVELRWVLGALRFWDPTTGSYLPDLTEAKAERDAALNERDSALAQRDAALERVRQLEAELGRELN